MTRGEGGLRQASDRRLSQHDGWLPLEIVLPRSFPEKYRAAVVRAAEGCKVKKTILAAPDVEVGLAPRAGDGPQAAA